MLIEGLSEFCSRCAAPLCIRKQVLNLALGETTQLLCLTCLATAYGQAPQQILQQMKSYVLSRDCFRKPWERYLNTSYCPEPETCFPTCCFAIDEEQHKDNHVEEGLIHPPVPKANLDLRGVACPLNYVKTKLYLDKLNPGALLTVLLDAGEPVESVSSSLKTEGHQILNCQPELAGHFCLTVCKAHPKI